MQEKKVSEKARVQVMKGKKKKKRVARSGAPRGERLKTRLRREQADRARELLHVATPEAKVASKKRKKLSPQQKAAKTKKASLARTLYYVAHDRTPTERTRVLPSAAEVGEFDV